MAIFPQPFSAIESTIQAKNWNQLQIWVNTIMDCETHYHAFAVDSDSLRLYASNLGLHCAAGKELE